MKKKKEISIKLTKVSKQYTLHHQKPTFAENVFRRSKKEIFTALSNINLTIYQGEKVGIIGQNGAGKTTLLKIIAGITTPNTGKVITNGKIVSLIDLEAGFHPDLTGEENIFLNGMILGMSKREIKNKYQEIVNFADIGQFIDAPLYTYSSGMKLRLGFSIAVNADPDILVLDENISAGDQNFQEKSIKKVDEFFRAGKTILVVTHWLEFLEENVGRIIWIDDHKIKRDGGKKVLKEYRKKY